MIGDEAACARAFAALEARVQALRLEELSSGGEQAAGWAALVPRFRALRESLTSEAVTGSLPLAAYLLAAEACLRAGDAGEYLKCQQRLVQELLPAAEPPSERWPELAACALLYFATAVEEAGEVSAALRATPPRLLRTRPLRCALAALAALRRRDGAAFCAAACSEAATPLMRLLLARKLESARVQGLSAFARAYRALPATTTQARLGLRAGELGELLARAAAAPGGPKQLAVAHRAWSAGGVDLVFVAA